MKNTNAFSTWLAVALLMPGCGGSGAPGVAHTSQAQTGDDAGDDGGDDAALIAQDPASPFASSFGGAGAVTAGGRQAERGVTADDVQQRIADMNAANPGQPDFFAAAVYTLDP